MDSSIQVNLGFGGYVISFSANAADAIAVAVAGHQNAGRMNILLCDTVVARAHPEFVERAFGSMPRLLLEGGERTKSITCLSQVLDFLSTRAIDRRGVLWVVGGGVVGDLGGFAAGVYLRGIDYVQVPTTLLAMVDSSIGGKTGLNLPAGKNLAGVFHQPIAVFVSADFLPTLPPREFAAGMAEVIKYGLLGDAALFARLGAARLTASDPGLLSTIRRCAEIKAAIVQADERETAPEGGRALLNLGHTFGHAIEQATRYEEYLHGEAVAVGLIGAARLSQKLGYLSPADVATVEQTVAAHELPIRLRRSLGLAQLLEAMNHDKKARAGRWRFVVLRQLGQAATQSDIDPALVSAVWRELGATG